MSLCPGAHLDFLCPSQVLPTLTLHSIVFQDQLIRNSASGTCLTSRDKKPAMAPCNPTDPHQLWLFV